jgi:hypothetical protein
MTMAMLMAMLNRAPGRPHNGGVNEETDEEVKALLQQLDALGRSVRRREEANEKDRAAIRELLPAARKLRVGPATLERAIHGVYVAGTISRWTKDVAPPRD